MPFRTLILKHPADRRRGFIGNSDDHRLGAGTARRASPAEYAGNAAASCAELCPAGVAFSQPDWALQAAASGARRAWPTLARIDSLMHDGKLYLSLNDAIALALENNLDIAIARYNLNIADTDVLRAKAGARLSASMPESCRTLPAAASAASAARSAPVPAAPLSARAAAGAGTGGLVSSTSWPRTADQQLRSGSHRHAAGRSFQPNCHQLFQGFFRGPSLAQNTGTVNFAYNQAFQWGTNLSVGFNNTRHRPRTAFSPA